MRSWYEKKQATLPKWMASLCFALIVVAVWEIAALAADAPYIVPTPVFCLERLAALCGTAVFWASIGWSLLRIGIGFTLGFVLGAALALLSCEHPWAKGLLSPLMKMLRTIPVACVILLILLWVAPAFIPVIITALVVLVLTWTNASEGISAIDDTKLELAYVFELSYAKRLTEIYLPSIATQLRASASLGMGMAWKSGITAEVLCLPVLGMGTQVYQAKVALEAADIFAFTVVIVALSLLLEKLVRRIVARRAA